MTPARAQQLLLLRDSTPSTIISGSVIPHMTVEEIQEIDQIILRANARMNAGEVVRSIAEGEVWS
jgi:hypothetical protein